MNDLLEAMMKRANVSFSAQLRDPLAQHWQMLSAANREFNLTAIADEAEAAEKHYLDSLLPLPRIRELIAGRGGNAGTNAGISDINDNGGDNSGDVSDISVSGGNSGDAGDNAVRIADIGSGGGFPGLVLAVCLPEAEFTLLEATGKKCGFLRDCAAELGLDNVTVLQLRAEEAGRLPELRFSFDLVTARAVAPLNVLAEYALPLLKQGGRLLAYKGPEYESEMAGAEQALKALDGAVANVSKFQLPSGGERAVVEIISLLNCAQKYPRRPGMPSKRPL